MLSNIAKFDAHNSLYLSCLVRKMGTMLIADGSSVHHIKVDRE